VLRLKCFKIMGNRSCVWKTSPTIHQITW